MPALMQAAKRCIAALGRTIFEPHAHECPNCSTIWAHDPNAIKDETAEIFDRAHSCPKCGTEQTYTYNGDVKPSWFNSGDVCKPFDGDCILEYAPERTETQKAVHASKLVYMNLMRMFDDITRDRE